jgi:hypothetical protein
MPIDELDESWVSHLMDDTLRRLQKWYADQCDGDWEHERGIEIGTLDNPGWRLTIDLAGSEMSGRLFEPIERGLERDASTDWHSLSVTDDKFQAAGDPSKLDFMIRTFLDWADRVGTRPGL